MKGKAYIPNALTLGNLICGIFCILFVNDPDKLLFFFLLAGLLDFLDGFVARWLKVSGEIGKQLDSLSDVLTFGVVPAYVWYHECYHQPYLNGWGFYLSHTFLLIAIASSYRLAKFNVATDQTVDFKGLPTPANAIFWVGLFYCYSKYEEYSLLSFINTATFFYCMLVGTILFSFLMISNIPIFGLKFKNFSLKDNIWKFVLLTSALILLVFLKWLALPLIVILYILLSLIKNWTT